MHHRTITPTDRLVVQKQLLQVDRRLLLLFLLSLFRLLLGDLTQSPSLLLLQLFLAPEASEGQHASQSGSSTCGFGLPSSKAIAPRHELANVDGPGVVCVHLIESVGLGLVLMWGVVIVQCDGC